MTKMTPEAYCPNCDYELQLIHDLAARIAELEAELASAERQDFFDLQGKIAAALAREAKLREAIYYVLDGYGLDAPYFERQPEDDEDDWIVTRLRAVLQETKT